MSDALQRVGGLLLAWVAFAPGCLVAFCAMGWGWVALSTEEIRRAGVLTAVASAALGLPVAWAVFAYFSRFNPNPASPPWVNGGLFALLVCPVNSTLIALVPFELTTRAALRRGAGQRPAWIRGVSGVTLVLVVLAAFGVLGVACLFAAGPKALG
jgi:hypothetical protein